MSRLLFFYEWKTPTSVMMKKAFMDSGVMPDVCFKEVIKAVPGDLIWADVVILIRPTDILSVRIARKAKKMGRYVIAFFDDDLMNRPEDRPIISWRRTNVARALNTSDIVMSSSLRICEEYKGMTIQRRGVKADTAVYPDEFRTNSKTDSDTVRIVYAANASHDVLFEKYISPAIPLLGRVKKQIKFTFIGVHPRIGKERLPDNVQMEYVKGMPFSDYRNYMDSHDFDLGLAPLGEDEFSKCKYINKFLEYAIFQIPGIFSNVEPYTSMVKDGENGYLADNTENEWSRRLVKIVSDREGYSRCGLNAMQMVKREFNASYVMHRLFEEIPELVKYNAPERTCSSFLWMKTEYAIRNLSEKLFLCASYLKKSGFTALKDKICIHIKEKRTFEKI